MPPQAEGSNASTARIGKERRERNREAQQQFRKRKQINDDARLQRLKRLEGVIEKMSTVMVDFTDRLLREDVIQQHPGLITSVQGVITDILALANEAGDPEDGPGTRRTRGITHQGEDGAPAVSEVRLSGPSSDPAVTLDSAMPALVQQEDVFDHSPFKDIFSTQNPSVEHSVGSLDVAAPLLYSRASHLLSAIPQTLGPILWNTSKPLPPNSFSYRLTYSCFSLGNLVLSKSVQSPIPLSEENRMFGSTLRYRQRDEMILRMRWLLGPGTYELRQLAELPWGGRWWDQEFSGSDLASYATATTSIDSSAPQFLSVIGVEKQLVALGVRIVDRETIELSTGSLTILSEIRQEPACMQPDSWSFVNLFPSDIPRPKFDSLTIRVSVGLLIENLCRIGVCLMKGPGFPRQALRRVIEESVVT